MHKQYVIDVLRRQCSAAVRLADTVGYSLHVALNDLSLAALDAAWQTIAAPMPAALETAFVP